MKCFSGNTNLSLTMSYWLRLCCCQSQLSVRWAWGFPVLRYENTTQHEHSNHDQRQGEILPTVAWRWLTSSAKDPRHCQACGRLPLSRLQMHSSGAVSLTCMVWNTWREGASVSLGADWHQIAAGDSLHHKEQKKNRSGGNLTSGAIHTSAGTSKNLFDAESHTYLQRHSPNIPGSDNQNFWKIFADRLPEYIRNQQELRVFLKRLQTWRTCKTHQ